MDIRKVKKLIELLEESGVAEIEISEGDDSVRISRYPVGAPVPAYAPAPVVAAAPAAAPGPAVAAAEPASAAPAAPAAGGDEGHEITSPMVGTYYASSSPGAAPFVQVGDRIDAGDTLCIIEAMKMMNPIESDVAGVVKSVRCQNGDATEFGQVLFVIDQRSGD